MSCWQWERGTLKIPTAEFSKLRKTVEAEDRRLKNWLFDHSQKFWKGLSAKQKSSQVDYRAAARAYCDGGVNTGSAIGHVSGGLRDSLADLLATVSDPPKRVLKSDLNFPTNRTTRFRVGTGSAAIMFNRDDSTVKWLVESDNWGAARAHEYPLAEVFFAALSRVHWSRGTGGVIVGNDENNQDSQYVGGGGNYVTFAIGPIGQAEDPWKCSSYLDSKGRVHNPQVARMGLI